MKWTIALAAMMAALWWMNRPTAIVATMMFASDGDSFTLSRGTVTTAVRLRGLDAPEIRQSCADAGGRPWRCGLGARDALARLVPRGAAIECRVDGTDRFARALSRCALGDGRDLGAVLVEAGWAVATDEDYGVEEDAARSARRGIWQGEFLSPAEWRAANPRQ